MGAWLGAIVLLNFAVSLGWGRAGAWGAGITKNRVWAPGRGELGTREGRE